jgi:DNA-binding response OmpR family regulator
MAQTTDEAACRLLAVEDDPDSSDLIVRTAKRCGYATRAAPGAESLRETIQDFRPHVITLDLCLPNIDGMEVITLINQAAFKGELIIISGQDEWIRDFTRKVALECGLSVPAHMAKPIDLSRLRELLTGIRTDRAGTP